MIVVVLGLLLVSGVLGGGSGFLAGPISATGRASPAGHSTPRARRTSSSRRIVADIQDYWAETFSQSGRDYPVTDLVLFDRGDVVELRAGVGGDRTLLLPGRPEGLPRPRLLR